MLKFKFLRIICLVILGIVSVLQAHEGHHAIDLFTGKVSLSDQIGIWVQSIGRFHLLFLHFPIALTVMTVAAECLWIWFANPVFSHAARFMIISAAIFAVPTALLGFAFSYGQHYEGLDLNLYMWHRNFGLLTVGLAILAAILREYHLYGKSTSLASYYICLFLLFLSVSLTGAFGGSLAFGLDVW